MCVFFFKQKTAYEMRISDWSSDGALPIYCAGPFLGTATPLIEAALRAGVHYLDVTAEQAVAAATFERFDAAALRAGVVVAPAMAFYGGLADALATVAVDEWPAADEIGIGVALDSWQPTAGTRPTGKRNNRSEGRQVREGVGRTWRLWWAAVTEKKKSK